MKILREAEKKEGLEGRDWSADLEKGEEVILPCKHCCSVALRTTLEAGEREVRCDRCRGTTRIRLARGAEGWTVKAEAGAEPPSPGS